MGLEKKEVKLHESGVYKKKMRYMLSQSKAQDNKQAFLLVKFYGIVCHFSKDSF